MVTGRAKIRLSPWPRSYALKKRKTGEHAGLCGSASVLEDLFLVASTTTVSAATA